ncbi:hypothetical protein GGR52DRAFT_566060 [Hypoxylon sp. FL1284]|nr:hypothetical protein GGR52DRAFT_566060 [Hypoxylon sp. FL1284]
MAANISQSKSAGSGSGSGSGVPGQDKEMTDEEQQLNLYMNHLRLLHIKCAGLRGTLQNMLDSLPNTISPDEMYERFSKAIEIADGQIKEFGALYNSEESKKVFDQAKKSRDANPKGIKPWRAQDHPDWMDLP